MVNFGKVLVSDQLEEWKEYVALLPQNYQVPLHFTVMNALLRYAKVLVTSRGIRLPPSTPGKWSYRAKILNFLKF
jgi:hypothetical protein